MKKGTVSMQPGKPLEFTEVEDDSEATEIDPETGQISAFIKAYGLEARNLLNTRYSGLRDVAPLHLREPCHVFAIRCTDGMVV